MLHKIVNAYRFYKKLQSKIIITLLILYINIISIFSAQAADLESISSDVSQYLTSYNQDNRQDEFIIKLHPPAELNKNNQLELVEVQEKFNNNKNTKNLAKQLLVTVKDSSSGIEYKILGSYEAGVKLLVPISNIQANQPISIDNLEWASFSANQYGAGYLNSEEDVNTIGKIAKKNLTAKKPIKLSDINQEYIVKKGQTVTLKFTKHNLTIETTGICLEHGRINEVIKIRNIDSNKILQGVVADSKNILVLQ